MPKESGSDHRKAITSGTIEPGACYEHYSPNAGECKVCFVSAQCEIDTETRKLQEDDVPDSGGTPFTVDGFDEALRSFMECRAHKETDKLVMWRLVPADGKEGEPVKVGYSKSSGHIRIEIAGRKQDIAPPETHEEGVDVAEKIAESAAS